MYLKGRLKLKSNENMLNKIPSAVKRYPGADPEIIAGSPGTETPAAGGNGRRRPKGLGVEPPEANDF